MSIKGKRELLPWPVVCRGLLVMLPLLLCIAIEKAGSWAATKGDAGFDALMDWAHGNKDWRYK